MTKKTISIAMSVYNSAEYLQSQLDSLICQTRLPDQLIICDDASTDDTPGILARFRQKAPFSVRIETNNMNLGCSESLIKAAELCEGDIIFFCDHDDVWIRKKLELCEAEFQDNDVFLVTHSVESVDRNLNPYRPPKGIFYKKQKVDGLELPLRTSFSGHSIAFSSDILHKCKFIKELQISQRAKILSQRTASVYNFWGTIHDMYVSYCAKIMGKIVFLNDILVLRRMHGRNLSGQLIQEDRSFKLTGDTKSYEEVSFFLIDAASLFETAAGYSPELENRLLRAAKISKNLSVFYRKRGEIYDPSLAINYKSKIFISLILQGAYISNQYFLLGIGRFLKDFLVLLLGENKLSYFSVFFKTIWKGYDRRGQV